MKDLKFALKMIGYGMNLKVNIIGSAVFFAIGISCIFTFPFVNGTGLSSFCGFYMTMGGMYVGQSLMTSSVSTLVRSSPYRKKLQTTILAKMTLTVTLLLEILCFLICGLSVIIFSDRYADPQLMNQMVIAVLATGVIGGFYQLYIGCSYKKFLISYILMLVIMLPVLYIVVGSFPSINLSRLAEKFNFLTAVLTALAFTTVCAPVGCLLSKALYRCELSETACKGAMRQR